MDYFRRLLSYHRQRQKPAALSSSALDSISLDILLCITDYLPLESAVAFFLSCSHLKHLLGLQQFSKLASSTEHTLALLDLLAIDLPNCIVCVPCRRLHKMENLQRYNSATYSSGSKIRQYDSLRLPVCVAKDRNDDTGRITDLFGATAFKMAIKRHHQQPGYTRLLSIMSNKAAQTVEHGGYVRQSREECRVIRGRLMHRLQNVRISRTCLNGTTFVDDLYPEMICPHIKLRRSMLENRSGIRRCRECRTEYSIDFNYYNSHGRAMFFTRWKDLGPDPENEVWKQHIPPRMSDLFLSFIQSGFSAQTSMGVQTQVERQSQDREISSAFGDGNDFKFDSWLTPKNKSELLRFQKQCVVWQ
jgi:hypothetical protein